MNLIFGYDNVYFDSRSDYDPDSVNEKQYLKTLFLNLKQILDSDFNDFEFYILFSHNSAIIPDSFSIEKENKILFWFSDETGAFPAHLTDNYRAIFKCYIKEEGLNVFSNPLGYVNEFAENSDRAVDKKDVSIFFAGSLGKNRVELYKMLFLRRFGKLNTLKILPGIFFKAVFKFLNISDLGQNGSVILFSRKFKSGLDYPNYYNYLLRSRFVLCPKGIESEETFRHFEALHTEGIIISEKMPDVSIYKGNPFIIYETLEELKQILHKIARNEYDEPTLVQKHRLYYQSKQEIKVVAARIAQICKEAAI